ncbi:transposase [Pauljensenia sp. 20925_1_25]|uniref:transposase n=1 Tax=Pauljensenia sp. 20925_1_25 TaxID=3003692 RepID=UPI00352C8165
MTPSTKSGFFCAPHTRKLTPRQQERLREAFTADEAHISVEVAYHCAQQVREVFHQDTPTQGRRLATHLIQRLPACPIPEIARLGANHPTQMEGRTRRLLRHRQSKQRTPQKPSTESSN